MAILTKTKFVILFALVLFAAGFLLSPKVNAATPVDNGLYSAHVMNDSSKIYMQIRIDGDNVVLGAGEYGDETRTPSKVSCLRKVTSEPVDANDNIYSGYSGEFDINAMYNVFRSSSLIYKEDDAPVTGTFPGAITEIAHGAFKGWTSLTKVVVPSSVEVIGSDAFADSSVTSVDFSQATNLTDIKTSTFQGCTNLQSIDLSKTKITTLSSENFEGCDSLSSVKLPDTLTAIDQAAFENTTQLTQLTIPANVNFIDPSAFVEDNSVSPKTKTLKFTGDFDESFFAMAISSQTYVKLLFPAGNPTWENSTSVQKLVSSGKAASYITTTPQTPPAIYSDKVAVTVHTEGQQTVSSEIEDTSQAEASTASSEGDDTVQEQGEGQSGISMIILIAILAIVCIGGGVLIVVRARKNK